MSYKSTSEIWATVPLSRDQIKHIIAAPGTVVKSSEFTVDDFETLLAFYVIVAISGSAQLPVMPIEVKLRIAKAFKELVQSMMKAEYYSDTPPATPPDWIGEMFEWDNNGISRTRKVGAKPRELDELLYPRLLGFYELAYGVSPAHTLGGPTERFLMSFTSAMFELAKSTKWIHLDNGEVDTSVLEKLPRPADPFRLPTPQALAGRIREHRDANNVKVARKELSLIKSLDL